MSRTAFQRLADHISREYLAKGYSPARARYIGRAKAGEVATAKHKRAKRAARSHGRRR